MTGNTYHQAPDSLGAAPSGCPLHARWSPLDDDYLADPYPVASALRDEHPIFYARALGHVVVTTMADIEAVFLNPDIYASTNVQDPIFPLAPEAAAVLPGRRLRPGRGDVEPTRTRPRTDSCLHAPGLLEPAAELARGVHRASGPRRCSTR